MTIVVPLTNQTSLLKDLPAKYDIIKDVANKVITANKGKIVTKGGLALGLVQIGVIGLGSLIANQLNTASVPEVYENPKLPPAYKPNQTRRGRGGYSLKYNQYNRSYKSNRYANSCKHKRSGNRFNCKRHLSSRRSKPYFRRW